MYQLDSTKGWHSDFEPQTQPAGTYRKLVNGVRSLSGGIQSEPSSSPILNLGGLSLLGWCELTQELILFLGNGADCQVGVLGVDDVYTPILNTPELTFDLAYRVCSLGKKNFKGERVVYFTDGKNPLRFLNLDSPPTVDIADNLQLFTYASLPTPTWLPELENSGEVPTGVYQVVARQLTRSTNPTSYGLLSEVLPVVEENRAVGRDQFDGALPQTPTSKALQVRFDNLDKDFPFLQVVIITFQGTGNQFQAYEVGTIGLNGRTSYTFTYRGVSQHVREVPVEELVTQPIRYETARVLSQKDGILVASNLTTKPKPAFSFQELANQVSLRYTIEEVDITTLTFQDYKDELLSATKRGYRRGETYAFALSPLYRDYQDTTAYHIPAPPYLGTFPQEAEEVGTVDPANTSSKALGTYQSSEEYPEGFDYPTGLVRYHVLPTLAQEPMLVTRGGVTYLRLLGIEADFSSIPLLPDEVSKDLVGFQLLRLERTLANSRILTQGIASPHMKADNLPTMGMVPWGGHPSVVNGHAEEYFPRLLGFLSPEVVFDGTAFPGVARSGQYLRAVTQLYGNQVLPSSDGQSLAEGDRRYNLLLDYTQHLPLPVGQSFTLTLDQSATDQVPVGRDTSSTTPTENTYSLPDGTLINLVGTNGYQFFKTTTDPDFNTRYYNGRQGETWYDDKGDSSDEVSVNGVYKGGADIGIVGSTQRNLYNLTISRSAQYGKVEDGVYHRIGTYSLGSGSSVQVWGGDTFLVKWAVVTTATSFPVQARSLQYFWCESSHNLNYRHYLKTVGIAGNADYQQGTLPYYPKYPTITNRDPTRLGILDFSPALGHSAGYNHQYSFQDKLLSYFPKGITEEEVTQFENRSIYSQQSVEGEQLDAYRVFLPNDYQDIPKVRGPITQTFTLGNTFYVHTSQGLWRTFFNEQVSQAASSGEVYLGTGGVFTRPPVEVVPVEGGYAGTQGQWGITTPYGHFFPDTYNHKVWKLAGDGQLEDLTKQGIRKWAMENITLVADQPALGKGYTLAWDYRLERLLVTKLTTPAVV